MAYSLLKERRMSYKDDVKLPRAERCKQPPPDKLYPIQVLEQREDSVKIHYIRYSSSHDEWRNQADVLSPGEEPVLEEEDGEDYLEYTPYNAHAELAFLIKQALQSRRDPEVQISMPFDPLVFNGGLRLLGRPTDAQKPRKSVFTIQNYADLKPLLGDRWHIRGVNLRGDFCYVNRDSVRFYLRRKKPLKDYLGDGQCTLVQGSFVLVFKFVRMDEVHRELAKVLSLK